MHNLHIGRSKKVYKELAKFLQGKNYEISQGTKGGAILVGVSSKRIAEIINLIESDF